MKESWLDKTKKLLIQQKRRFIDFKFLNGNYFIFWDCEFGHPNKTSRSYGEHTVCSICPNFRLMEKVKQNSLKINGIVNILEFRNNKPYLDWTCSGCGKNKTYVDASFAVYMIPACLSCSNKNKLHRRPVLLEPGTKNGNLIVVRPLGIIAGHSKVLIKNITNNVESIVNTSVFLSGKIKLHSPEQLKEIYRKNIAKSKSGTPGTKNFKNAKFTWNNIYDICDNKRFIPKNLPPRSDEKVYRSRSKEWIVGCHCGNDFNPTLNALTCERSVMSCGCVKTLSQREVFDFIINHYSDALFDKRSYFQENKRIQIDIFIPSLSLAIEFMGEYWHSQAKAIRNDKIKRELFVKYNYSLYEIFWEDWNKDKKLECDKLLKFCDSLKIKKPPCGG